MNEYDQNAKADAGKPRLTLVPQQIIWDIAKVREFGTEKYKDPDNWKRVEIERYRDAAFRHMLRYLADPHGYDDESGLPHLYHLATNISFLCELETYADKPESNCVGCQFYPPEDKWPCVSCGDRDMYDEKKDDEG